MSLEIENRLNPKERNKLYGIKQHLNPISIAKHAAGIGSLILTSDTLGRLAYDILAYSERGVKALGEGSHSSLYSKLAEYLLNTHVVNELGDASNLTALLFLGTTIVSYEYLKHLKKKYESRKISPDMPLNEK